MLTLRPASSAAQTRTLASLGCASSWAQRQLTAHRECPHQVSGVEGLVCMHACKMMLIKIEYMQPLQLSYHMCASQVRHKPQPEGNACIPPTDGTPACPS